MTNTIVTKPEVAAFFDKDSNTFSYVVKDPTSSSCAIVDSVLDFDYASGGTSYKGADSIIEYVTTHKLKVEWLIETHVHADHLSAAPYIQSKVGGKIGIGEQITIVQDTFGKIFNEGTEFKLDGSQFDHLFHDGEHYQVGSMLCTALHTPGHTPACFTHVLGDAVFVGDTLFMPDAGTARADFPGGDAGTLFDSVQKILALPEDHRIFMCHDYCPNGRELEYETTVKAQRALNIHVKKGISKETFVELRETRDKTLAMPRLILPSLQINMRAGHMPEPENNGLSYLKIPLNAFK
ncbi:MBL fold metallo-hydrolase [Marinomonas shanghaiensis]|uniref:MBL fold metallo-hydrolase n=1 Tax=Marinomonas shanghaiensis TaxID=2202418 RepID=UPI000DB956B8|nr:MBL fold metallo-hydrolase [Marinomonas shanghaiensis]